MCVLVFLICEITSKTNMIVDTEAWVLCEVNHTMFYKYPSYLFWVWLGSRIISAQNTPKWKGCFIMGKIGNDLTNQNYWVACMCVRVVAVVIPHLVPHMESIFSYKEYPLLTVCIPNVTLKHIYCSTCTVWSMVYWQTCSSPLSPNICGI